MMHSTASQLARLLNLSERRIQQLAREGVIPKSQRGQYALLESVQGYCRYLRQCTQDKQAARGVSPLNTQRLRLLKAQTAKAEVEYQQKRQQLIHQATATQVMVELLELISMSLTELPKRCFKSLPNGHDSAIIKQHITLATRAQRAHLAAQLGEYMSAKQSQLAQTLQATTNADLPDEFKDEFQDDFANSNGL